MYTSVYQIRQIKKLQSTASGRPKNRVHPTDRDVHLEDLISMLLCEDQETRAYKVRDIRRHPFFKTIDWDEMEKGNSPTAFTPQPILQQMEDLNMNMEEFLVNEGVILKKHKDVSRINEELIEKWGLQDWFPCNRDSESSTEDTED
ncbi:uncharacterized protein LOC143986784 isoform X1 [Lithobates pipiens]